MTRQNTEYPQPDDSHFEEKFVETFLQDKQKLINTLAGM